VLPALAGFGYDDAVVLKLEQCAIGIRVHSGWGAVVAVSGEANSLEVIVRRRVEIIDPKTPGAVQPYHFAQDLELPAAEKHIAKSAAESLRLAVAALRALVDELRAHAYRVQAAAILLSSARPLPELRMILASHPMIHTAEGEFFRQAFREACAGLKISVTGIRERELDEKAKDVLGRHAALVKKKISDAGKIIGAPWTNDQKTAALAAALLLAEPGL
jgi:hypothetical protein